MEDLPQVTSPVFTVRVSSGPCLPALRCWQTESGNSSGTRPRCEGSIKALLSTAPLRLGRFLAHQKKDEQNLESLAIACFLFIVFLNGTQYNFEATHSGSLTGSDGKPLDDQSSGSLSEVLPKGSSSASAALERTTAAYSVSFRASTQKGGGGGGLSDAMSFFQCACVHACACILTTVRFTIRKDVTGRSALHDMVDTKQQWLNDLINRRLRLRQSSSSSPINVNMLFYSVWSIPVD